VSQYQAVNGFTVGHEQFENGKGVVVVLVSLVPLVIVVLVAVAVAVIVVVVEASVTITVVVVAFATDWLLTWSLAKEATKRWPNAKTNRVAAICKWKFGRAGAPCY